VRLALAEAAVLGLVATVIGLVLGQLLATGLVDLVLRTIGDLYFSRTVTAAPPSPFTYGRGAALGVVATLIAAAKPAIDAARTAPAAALRRAELERGARRGALGAVWAALHCSQRACSLCGSSRAGYSRRSAHYSGRCRRRPDCAVRYRAAHACD